MLITLFVAYHVNMRCRIHFFLYDAILLHQLAPGGCTFAAGLSLNRTRPESACPRNEDCRLQNDRLVNKICTIIVCGATDCSISGSTALCIARLKTTRFLRPVKTHGLASQESLPFCVDTPGIWGCERNPEGQLSSQDVDQYTRQAHVGSQPSIRTFTSLLQMLPPPA